MEGARQFRQRPVAASAANQQGGLRFCVQRNEAGIGKALAFAVQFPHPAGGIERGDL
jgi:hypothetical protein